MLFLKRFILKNLNHSICVGKTAYVNPATAIKMQSLGALNVSLDIVI